MVRPSRTDGGARGSRSYHKWPQKKFQDGNMGERGRKSAADLSAVTLTEVHVSPDSPYDFTGEQAEIWRAICLL